MSFGFRSICVEKSIPAGGDKPRPYAYSGLAAVYHPVAAAKRRHRNVGVGFMPTRYGSTGNCRHLSLLSAT